MRQIIEIAVVWLKKKDPIDRRLTSWLFTNVANELDSRTPRMTPASGQKRT